MMDSYRWCFALFQGLLKPLSDLGVESDNYVETLQVEVLQVPRDVFGDVASCQFPDSQATLLCHLEAGIETST